MLVPLALPSQSLAQGRVDPTGQTLRNQQEQIQELNRMLQVQANQKQIERLQERLLEDQNQNQQPQVVVVQPERRGPTTGEVLLGVAGIALSNGYVDCGPRGNCAYGFGNGYRGGYGGYRGYGRVCSWGSGYQGCYHRKVEIPNEISEDAERLIELQRVQRELNQIIPVPRQMDQTERFLRDLRLDCSHWTGDGCAAGYNGIRW